MRQRIISIIVVLLCCRIIVFSIEVNKDFAMHIGVSFLRQKANTIGVPVIQSLSDKVECLTDTAFPHLYILNTENGWAIMPNDTRVQPILAYSTQNANFDVNDIPDGLRCLLHDYDDAVRFAQDSLLDMEEGNPEWEQISTYSTSEEPKVLLERCTEVLWNQDENNDTDWRCTPSYNQLCPTFYTPACGHTYVGCTAVAMGQIMWYYKWPYYAVVPNSISEQGNPSSKTHLQWYDWNKMPSVLYHNTSSDEANLVATLLRDCGYAAKMKYRADGSGAGLKDAMEALSRIFGYSSNISYHKKSLTINWIKKIKAEIDAGRPVLYAAYKKEGGGHSFVIDGYEGDRFHINWGWGDTVANNGIYALELLKPESNTGIHYSKDHEALFGIEPSVNCSPVYSSGTVASNASYIEVGGENITLGNFIIESSAECHIYSGTQIRLTDGFVAKAGSSAHFAIRDVPCNNTRSVMYAPAYAKTMQENGTEIFGTTSSREFLVWPNPARDHIFVQSSDEICSVVVYSLLGQKLLQSSGRDINISNLPNGTYILWVNGRDKTGGAMFLKQ